jgi:uncharacterized ferredoxin-like protein
MARIDGNKAANENLLNAAKFAVTAALKAPRVAKTNIKVEILTGENLLPISEILGIIGEINAFVHGDSICIKRAFEQGGEAVALLVGGNAGVSDLNWNCGACGFTTCADFNKYSASHKSTGFFFTGPSCNWKVFDVSMATCWAAAALSQLNVENRVQDSTGFAAFHLGYLEGCTLSIGLMLGPVTDYYYYDRPELAHSFDMKEHEEFVMNCLPQFYVSFVGGGHPVVKTKDEFFVGPKYLKPVEDPDFLKKQQDIMCRIGEVIEREKKKNK